MNTKEIARIIKPQVSLLLKSYWEISSFKQEIDYDDLHLEIPIASKIQPLSEIKPLTPPLNQTDY